MEWNLGDLHWKEKEGRLNQSQSNAFSRKE